MWMTSLPRRVIRRLAYERGRCVKAFQQGKYRFISGYVIRSAEKRPPNEGALVGRLVDSYLAAKAQQPSSGPYAVAVEWKASLDKEWVRPRAMIDSGNLAGFADFLANFFRNEALSGFWGGDRMFERFVSDGWVTRTIRAGMMDRNIEIWREYFPDTPFSELAAPPIGNPWGHCVDGYLVYEPACAYHLLAAQFAKLLQGVHSPVVMEIGGGFGGLAWHLLKQMPHLKYIGFDLPENALLQTYYVSCAFPDARLLTYSEGMGRIDEATIQNHDIIILPNFMLPQVAAGSVDLVVNVRSLSEMPSDTVAEYLRQIDRISRRFFFHDNIYKERLDGLHGIPSVRFPAMSNFVELFSVESRWPAFDRQSGYPCRENFFVRSELLRS